MREETGGGIRLFVVELSANLMRVDPILCRANGRKPAVSRGRADESKVRGNEWRTRRDSNS